MQKVKNLQVQLLLLFTEKLKKNDAGVDQENLFLVCAPNNQTVVETNSQKQSKHGKLEVVLGYCHFCTYCEGLGFSFNKHEEETTIRDISFVL